MISDCHNPARIPCILHQLQTDFQHSNTTSVSTFIASIIDKNNDMFNFRDKDLSRSATQTPNGLTKTFSNIFNAWQESTDVQLGQLLYLAIQWEKKPLAQLDDNTLNTALLELLKKVKD